jgi:hypothetical protein
MFKYYIEEKEVDLDTFLYNIGRELETKFEMDYDTALDKNDPIMFESVLYTYSKVFKLLDFSTYLAKLNAYVITGVINKVLEMQKKQGTHIGMYKYQIIKGEK